MRVKPGGCAVRSLIPCPHHRICRSYPGSRRCQVVHTDLPISKIILARSSSTFGWLYYLWVVTGCWLISFPQFMADPAALDSAHVHWTKDRTHNHSAHQVEIFLPLKYSRLTGSCWLLDLSQEELFNCYRYLLFSWSRGLLCFLQWVSRPSPRVCSWCVTMSRGPGHMKKVQSETNRDTWPFLDVSFS